jgi:hypothetical protein
LLLATPIGLFAAALTPTLKIKGVDARLYYAYSGTLSDPITPATVLRNVIIGEGDAREPSTSTLIDVVVEGTAGAFDATWRVELVVTTSGTGRVVLRQTKNVGVLSKTGTRHVAFWLPDTGCEPLRVTATVGAASRSTNVPFGCGE